MFQIPIRKFREGGNGRLDIGHRRSEGVEGLFDIKRIVLVRHPARVAVHHQHPDLPVGLEDEQAPVVRRQGVLSDFDGTRHRFIGEQRKRKLMDGLALCRQIDNALALPLAVDDQRHRKLRHRPVRQEVGDRGLHADDPAVGEKFLIQFDLSDQRPVDTFLRFRKIDDFNRIQMAFFKSGGEFIPVPAVLVQIGQDKNPFHLLRRSVQ